MDEVDNIIIHSLRQIGCKIGDDVTSISSFPPELLVETVSKCLQLIKPSLALPKTLPPGMAQRFSATAALAEACSSVGFRGDIGYQTFLYSNVTEVRRVFMFLIERLPKESEKLSIAQPIDKLTALENVIQRNIKVQLQSPWLPQYCNKSGIRKYDASVISINGEHTKFNPQLNLNIPNALSNDERKKSSPELYDYWLKRSPSIFQQTKNRTLFPSIIHRNDIEYYNSDKTSRRTIDDTIRLINIQRNSQQIVSTSSTSTKDGNKDTVSQQQTRTNNDEKNASSSKLTNSLNKLTINCDSDTKLRNSTTKTTATNQNNLNEIVPFSPVEELNVELERLRNSVEELLAKRKCIQNDIAGCKDNRMDCENSLVQLKEERRIKERTCILLDNPDVNIAKMGSLITSSQDRMKKLKEQWDEHRKPLEAALEKCTSKNSNKSSQNKVYTDQIKSIREKSSEITEDLKMKSLLHTQLANELQKIDSAVTREAYTSRILEIIGNIRKQKTDIDKVLRDTRELQKQINNISGQLDRQFTVTDDLLFKTAKRDEYSKKAYKLLATLHSDCSDLVALVQETGSAMRDVRDLEDQIETEKARNVATNLEKITYDLKQMEKESKDLQEKIRKVENQIIQG